MSLSEDFAMYYNGTYIGYQSDDGKVLPFYVEAVEHDNNHFNLRGVSDESEAYGAEALAALKFYGTITDEEGDTTQISVGNWENKLVFELPDSQYVKYRNQYFWVSYRAQRTTKKGLTSRRLSGLPTFNWQIVMAMFDETPDENVFGGCLLRKDAELHYKGVFVGNFEEGDIITLVPEARHLMRLVQQEIPQCQTQVSQNT